MLVSASKVIKTLKMTLLKFSLSLEVRALFKELEKHVRGIEVTSIKPGGRVGR